ncbi:MAG: hydrogenase maturation protease [Holophagaceae bacterium]|nr:hydrogenase maturation protease [Holophagaceae bacterium]
MKRIICIGNAFQDGDTAGARVLARLADKCLPEDVEVVDGGLRGLDLLRLVEDSERVAFVDAVCGFAAPGEIVELEGEALGNIAAEGYGHAGGFSYFLGALPHLLKAPVPFRMVGLEAPISEDGIEDAAQRALAFATFAPDACPGCPGSVGR